MSEDIGNSYWGSRSATKIIIILLFVSFIIPGLAFAHSPSNMELEYNFFNQELSVTITHNVASPNEHFIESIEIFKNDNLYLIENYTSQPSLTTFTYVYSVEAQDGDDIEVTATCSISGGITESITIQEPDADEIVLDISPEITSLDENTQQTFTVSAKASGESLEGVLLDIDVKLGSASPAHMVSSGLYNFTYTSPDVNDNLDETMDIKGEKDEFKDGSVRLEFTVNEVVDTGGDCPPTLDGIIESDEYDFTASFDDGNLKLHWKVVDEAILLAMEGKTKGWVAIGIDPENRMKGADMIFGWVEDSGEVKIVDAFGTDPTGDHPPDTQQQGTSDILCFGGSESSDTTIIELKRLLSTGDSKDKDIPSNGEVTIIWAYGPNDNFDVKHSVRGYGKLNIATGEFSEIEPPSYWLIHAALLTVGFLLMLTGVIIAKAFKKRKWWLKTHKMLGIVGAILSILGLIMGFIMVQLSSGEHFRVPHAYVGFLAIIFAVLTLGLGFAQFKVKKNRKKIRMIHRWSGRITLVLMLLNIIFGLSLVGII
ncbi:MAG: hypothetical protein JSV09_11475 [Thermoplasmata archaeon]|nr:MAG: hypothetical protein JSV09_11475 [Thermoplasmata archaeon]